MARLESIKKKNERLAQALLRQFNQLRETQKLLAGSPEGKKLLQRCNKVRDRMVRLAGQLLTIRGIVERGEYDAEGK